MTTTNGGWQELDETQYHQLQTGMLKNKGSETQRDFLMAAKENEDFVSFMSTWVEIRNGATLPTFDGPLTEQSFKEPTADQELRMYQLWYDTPPSTACRVSFWAGVTLEHVRQSKVAQASWLAANGGVTESGEERIDHALAMKGDEGDKKVDDCVRTIFRRMSGLPAARGNRSVFVDCTFGRGWWRERLVSRISSRGQSVEDRTALLAAVRRNRAYWENLVTFIVSRGSVIGSADVQDAVINSLAKRITLNPNTPLGIASTTRTALRRLSNIAAGVEIGTLEFLEISSLVDELFKRVEKSYSQ